MRSYLFRFARLTILCMAIGLLTGLLVSFLIPPGYFSSAEMALEDPSAETGAAVHRTLFTFFLACQNEVLSRGSLSMMIQDPHLNLYTSEREKLPLEDVIENMRHAVAITLVDLPGQLGKRATGFRIGFTYSEPAKAQMTVQALMTRFEDVQRARLRANRAVETDRIGELETRLAALEKRLGIADVKPAVTKADPFPITLEVVEAPSLPADPVYPNRWLFMGIGTAAGLAMALAIGVSKKGMLRG